MAWVSPGPSAASGMILCFENQAGRAEVFTGAAPELKELSSSQSDQLRKFPNAMAYDGVVFCSPRRFGHARAQLPSVVVPRPVAKLCLA